MEKQNFVIKRGEVYYADLGSGRGSEQGGIRPVVIIQNNTGNKYSPTVIVASLTSQLKKSKMPTHVRIKGSDYSIEDSIIMLEQIRTLDKRHLKQKICTLLEEDIARINNSLSKSLAI